MAMRSKEVSEYDCGFHDFSATIGNVRVFASCACQFNLNEMIGIASRGICAAETHRNATRGTGLLCYF